MSRPFPQQYTKIDMGDTVIIDRKLKYIIELLSKNIDWFYDENILTRICERYGDHYDTLQHDHISFEIIDTETILRIIQTLSNHVELLKDERTLYIILYWLKIKVIKGVEFDFALNVIEKLRDEYNYIIPKNFIIPQTEEEALRSIYQAESSKPLIDVPLLDKPTLIDEQVTKFRDSVLLDMSLNQNSVDLNNYTEITHSIISIVHRMRLAFEYDDE